MKRVSVIIVLVIIALAISAQDIIKPVRIELAGTASLTQGIEIEYAIPITKMTIAPAVNISLLGGAVGARFYFLNELGTSFYVKGMGQYLYGSNLVASGLGAMADIGYRINFFKLMTAFVDIGASYIKWSTSGNSGIEFNYSLGLGIAL